MSALLLLLQVLHPCRHFAVNYSITGVRSRQNHIKCICNSLKVSLTLPQQASDL